MTASLNCAPNPAPPGSTVTITGTGFANQKTRLLLAGGGCSANVFRPSTDGVFSVGCSVSAVPGTYPLTAQQQRGKKWQQVASTTVVVQGAVVFVPGAPLSLAGAVADESVVLSWRPPTSNGGVAIVGYQVYQDAVLVGSPVASPYTASGLTNGVPYSFTVSAVNSVGEGAQTSPVVVTPAASVGRPFPPPVTTGSVNVPGSINATGTADASAALNAFLATVPNGYVINFPVNGIFRMDHALRIDNTRSNLVLDGHGSTLRANGSGGLNTDSPLRLGGANAHIAINDFKIVGNNPTPGKYWGSSLEDQYGIAVFGGSYIEIGDCEISNTYADGIAFAGVGGYLTNDNMWVHDCSIHDIGRMGISIESTTATLIERVDFIRVNWVVLDVEPELNNIACNHITFSDCTVGPQPHINDHTPSFFSAGGPLASNVGDITITGTVATGVAMELGVPNPGGTVRRYNVAITGNTSDTAMAGPVMVFAHVDGVTVTGNHQPLSSGALTSTSDCTSVTISGNT